MKLTEVQTYIENNWPLLKQLILDKKVWLKKTRNTIKIVAAIASASLVISILIFSIPTLNVSEKSNLSMAISTIFAVLLGIVAVLVALRVESIEHKSSMENKKNILSLACALRSILERNMTHYLMNHTPNKPAFEKETEIISNFFISPSYYAFVAWSASKDKPESNKWQVFFIELHEILATDNLDSDTINLLLKNTLGMLLTLEDKDFEDIEHNLNDISTSMQTFKDANELFLPFKILCQQAEKDDEEANEQTQLKQHEKKCLTIDLVKQIIQEIQLLNSQSKNCQLKRSQHIALLEQLNNLDSLDDLYANENIRTFIKENMNTIAALNISKDKITSLNYFLENSTPPLWNRNFQKEELTYHEIKRLIDSTSTKSIKLDLRLCHSLKTKSIDEFKNSLALGGSLKRWRYSDLSEVDFDIATTREI